MNEDAKKEQSYRLDWDEVNRLREEFWTAHRRAEEIRRRLAKLREQRRKLMKRL